MFKVSSPKKKKKMCSNGRLRRVEMDVLERSDTHTFKHANVSGSHYSQETRTHALTHARPNARQGEGPICRNPEGEIPGGANR